jgi:ribosomal protein S18 acetylase RimI-like enzyme
MRLRAPKPDDAEAILAVLNARDIADIGRPDYTFDDVTGDWKMPDADVARDFIAAEADGAIVGYAFVDRRGATVAVHPDHEGRGIGTALREASEERMAERGQPLVQTIVTANTAGLEHLRAAGYRRRSVYQRMRAPLEAVPAAPQGAAVRRFDPDAEGPATHELLEAALGEVEGSVPDPLEDWRMWLERHSPPQYLLALEDEGRLAAAAVGATWEEGMGYVAELGTAPWARGRGHGRTLLLALADAFRADGLKTIELSVHAANAPALGLYERIGMTPDFRAERWIRA